MIWEADIVVAISPVGVDGATARVVVEALLEGEPVPIELMVYTL